MPAMLSRCDSRFPTSSLVLALVLTAACSQGKDRGAPESLPVFAGDSLPFRYPPGLFIQQVQGDVTLRLYVDEYGRPVPDSTRVETPSTYPDFDSSAVTGAKDLVFRPALRGGKAIPYPVLFPIKFRVPDGPPMPGDSTVPTH